MTGFAGVLVGLPSAFALPILPGDINLDGKVNVSDVQCHVLATANPESPPECMQESTENADVSCDGSLNVSDLQMTVLLAVGNPLSTVVDLDGDARVNACDPDRDGDSWSDDCESAAGTDAADPDSHPNSAAECAGAILSTACRLSGTAGDEARCDVTLARQAGTLSASALETIVQVDPAAASIVRLETVRTCTEAECTYGDSAPPQTELPNAAGVTMLPACTSAPCSQPWALGKLGVQLGDGAGPALTQSSWSSPGVAVTGDDFVVSVVLNLNVDVDGLPVEIFGAQAEAGGEVFPAGLRTTDNLPTLVSEGPPAGAPCITEQDCDDGDPCTVNVCVAGTCDQTAVICDDSLSCTTDSCSPTKGCSVSLDEGACVFGGSCLSSDHVNCTPLVRLSEVATYGEDAWIELVHEGAATIRIEDFALSTGGAPWAVPAMTMAPFSNVLIRIGAGIDTPDTAYAGDALTALPSEGGEVVLWRQGALADYVAWGATNHPTLDIANASGIWSHGESLVVDAVPPGYTLQSNSDAGATAWNAAEESAFSNTVPCALIPCVEVACHEQEDGDFDGQADCEDVDCASVPECAAGSIEICDDTLDNDNNGLADCLDPLCAQTPACPALPTLSEVIFDADGAARIEITNLDVAPLPFDAIVLCTQSDCVSLAGGGSLYPASFLTVHTGIGGDNATERWLNGALGGLSTDSGELLLSATNPPTSDSVYSYVRWGKAVNATAPGGSLEGLATDAALWAPDTRIYTDALQLGDALARDPAGDGLAWAWDIQTTPSAGEGNPNCGSNGLCRESRCEDATDEDGDGGFDCQDADCDGWPGCDERVVVNEVQLSAGEVLAVEIANLGTSPASLADRSLVSGEQSFSLSEGVQLAPGQVLTIQAGDGEADAGVIQGLPFTLGLEGGELSLSHEDTLTDYVRWGVGVSTQEADAEVVGQWIAGESVETAGAEVVGQTLRYDGWGDRASDWSIAEQTLGSGNGIEFGHCGDGQDNDDDALFDCYDGDCETSELCGGELCDNDIDDDGNGDIDCADTFCVDKGPCLEDGKCDDGVDNDGDGLTDCEDGEDCDASGFCDESLHCDDDIDNDLNGLTDCDDGACVGHANCIEAGQCDDGIDNDGNGLTDCEEPSECGGEVHCLEPLNCSDGIDNDVDGLTDCADEDDCAGKSGCIEVICDDLIDDDGDGDVDCDDDECSLLPICVGAEPILALTELYLSSATGSHVIEVANLGPATGDVAGFALCSADTCFTIPPETDIKPGEFLLIETGSADDFDGHRFTGELLTDLTEDSGTLQLVTQAPPQGPEDILDFVQWGTDGQPDEALAVEAGQWLAGEAIPSGSYLAGLSSYTWLGTGEGAEHWAVHFAPSPGEPNATCDLPGICAELSCGDGADNDGDSFVDCEDGDCAQIQTCFVEGDHCADAIDNDADGLVDCQDTLDCGLQPHCNEALNCDDLSDNDLNGYIDCEDDACTGHPACSEGLNCSDQQDNDADGLYDCDDPECADDDHCRETLDECDDLYDNDNDGALDCDDSDCAGSVTCVEFGNCWDAVDNDANGETDCADLSCQGSPECDARVRLTEVAFDGEGHGTVEIGNPGVGDVEVINLWVCVNSTCIQIPEHLPALPSGSTVSLHSGSGEEVTGHFYIDSTWGLDISGGSVRLYEATDLNGAPAGLLDYVAWGSPDQVGAEEAAALGRWPANIAVPTQAISVGRSIGRYGVTYEPWRWAVWPSPSVTDGGQLHCQPELCVETWCGDGHDNDNDGLRDCLDPDCASSIACLEAGQCNDGRDNDSDNAVDCYDSDCASSADCAYAARFSELILDGASGGDTIELSNPFGSALQLGGAQLCSGVGNCYTIPNGVTLPGSGLIAIHAGDGGGAEATLQAGSALGDLSHTGGSLTLTNGGSPDDPAAVVAFVDWGPQAGSLHLAAVEAGVWRLGDRVETGSFASGFDSLLSDGSAPDASAWSISTIPTPASENPNCALVEVCRETRCFDGTDNDVDGPLDCQDSDCEEVPGCAPRVVINEIHFGDGSAANPAWIEIANLGISGAQISGWSLCAGELCHVIVEGELLGPGFQLLILGEGTESGAATFIGGALGDLDKTGGTLSLYRTGQLNNPDDLVDFVAWGTDAPAGDPHVAVMAGQWLPGTALTPLGLSPTESLHYGGSGEGAYAWTIAGAPTAASANQPCDIEGNCRELNCDLASDQDNDGLPGCADPDCAVFEQCDESLHCDNGLDDDGDGIFDCMDAACRGDLACEEELACGDASDNDLDGYIDCADVECAAKFQCDEGLHCDDGVDNDGDGLLDCQDDDCHGVTACPESSYCNDEADNDLDGLIDCQDPDCLGVENCDESAHCGDEIDNDLDGMTDCSDSECAGVGACAEGLACIEDDFMPLSCGEQTGSFLEGADEWDPNGACGVPVAGASKLYKLTAPCDTVMGVAVKQKISEQINILRLDGICHTASWCSWAGGVDYVTTECPGATPDEHCIEMQFEAVAGASYYLVLHRDENSSDGGDFGILARCSDCAESECGDAIDNDFDSLTDCDDPDCNCNEAIACDNDIDDDGDGATDCADEACFDHPICDEAYGCQDGVDQDLDGLIDCDDPDCPHYLLGDQEGFCDAVESPDAAHTSAGICSDGVDNDGDGLADCADPDCAATAECTEVGRCSDTLDNNSDGLTDCSDPTCATDPTCAGGTQCVAHGVLGCGATVTHDPAFIGSDVLGDSYCGHSGEHTGNPEAVYKVAANCDGLMRATLSHESVGTYTVSALEGLCSSSAFCGSPARTVDSAGAAVSLEWSASAGVDTYLVVEGHTDTVGSFTLNLVCVDCPEGFCGDGLDNDGDTLTDCDDVDCATVSPCAVETTCTDGVDDDLDGLTDCQDVDCAGLQGCHYACLPIDLSCGTSTVVDLSSTSGPTDVIEAYGCSGQSYAGAEQAIRIQVPNACSPTVSVERLEGIGFMDVITLDGGAPECSPETCSDLTIMGGDGRAEANLTTTAPGQTHVVVVDGRDGFEGKARVAVSCCSDDIESFCSDGIDSDGDGLTDCDDNDCQGLEACIPETLCGDGLDNDSDGAADCQDTDCEGSPVCVENVCTDGLDSDTDGLTDCDDDDCNDTVACTATCASYLELGCGIVATQQSTLDGESIFSGYHCAPGDVCSGGGYLGPEQSYAIVPNCDTEVTVEVYHEDGHDEFFAAYLGQSCDEALQSCGGVCSVPTSAAEGTATQPAVITFNGQAGKAHWVNVESATSVEGAGTTFSLGIQCSCP
ncbi:MAG: hypothetical protein ACPGU1_05660 [Myxococcota bacterium]